MQSVPLPPPMIHTTNLTKRYGSTLALDALTLSVPRGAVFGLVGPNGSGKTTLFKLLMGFIFPDAGQIDLGTLPTQIGYMPDRAFFPTRFHLAEYLAVAGQLSGLRGSALRATVAENLRRVGLGDAARMRLSACSKGMLQRLALAAALLADPPLLLLDEPMAGLDPAGQKAMRDLIASLPPSGKTVLLSTHRLSEVAEICTHVAILRRGCLVRVGPLAEVLPPRPRVTITVDQITPELAAALAHQHPDIVIKGNVITLDDQAIAQKNAVIRGLLENGADLQDLRHERASLEEIYLEAMRG